MENQIDDYENNEPTPEEEIVDASESEGVEVETVKFEGCAKHNELPFIGECLSCGKKLCRECRAERGYFCSDECLEKSRSTVDTTAREEFKKTQASTEKIAKIIKTCALLITLFIVFIVAKWVYVEFLDPAGSMVWQWKITPPVNDFLLIACKDDNALVKRENSAVIVDLKTGQEISSSKDDVLGSCDELVKRLDAGGALLRGKRLIAMLNGDGTVGWSKKFNYDINKIVIAENDAVLVKTAPERDLYEKLKPDDVTAYLTVLELKNGGRRWRKEFTGFSYIYDLVAGAGKFVKVVSVFKDRKYESYMEVCDLKSGKPLWKIKSKKGTGSNLMLVGNVLLFQMEKTLSAVDLNTAEKLWQTPMKGLGWKNNIKVEGNNMLIDNGQALLCVNSRDGKKIWEKDIPESLESVAYADGRIYSIFVIYEESEEKVEEVKVDLPPAFDQLKDMDILSGEKNSSTTRARTTSKAFLTCQDMATGEELWRTPNVLGTCIAGNGKLVVVNDTSQLTFLNVSNGGLGSIIIRQFDPETGKQLFERVETAGLENPYFIYENKLIGCEYERIRGGVGGLQMGQKRAYLGLAAFLLK